MTARQLRSSPAWKRARAIKLRGATHCEICGQPLDFDAGPRSRWAPSVDHVDALVLGGAAFAQENLRAAHLGCNSSLGAILGNRSRRRVDSRAQADWW